MKKVLLALMAVVLCVGLVGAAFAYFSDSATSTSNTITAGTLAIDVNGHHGIGSYSFDLGTIGGNIAPGDTTGMATIKVTNTGTLDSAIYAKFTLTNDTGLAQALNFYNYKVQYYNADGSPSHRWPGPTIPYDGYFSNGYNMDWFIKDGNSTAFAGVGGTANLLGWVNGSGPEDIAGTDWDIEALPPGAYFIVSFQFQMDPAAGNAYQGKSVQLGYEVDSTQISEAAITALGLPTYGPAEITYLNSILGYYP